MTQNEAIKEMERLERRLRRPNGLMNSKEAAKFLGIHPVTMSRWIHSGRITPTPQSITSRPRFSIQYLKSISGGAK